MISARDSHVRAKFLESQSAELCGPSFLSNLLALYIKALPGFNSLWEPSNLVIRTLLHYRAKVFTPNEKRCQELFGGDENKVGIAPMALIHAGETKGVFPGILCCFRRTKIAD
jgi:hypothetical protein